jgi:hypothetical protein
LFFLSICKWISQHFRYVMTEIKSLSPCEATLSKANCFFERYIRIFVSTSFPIMTDIFLPFYRVVYFVEYFFWLNVIE